MHIILDANVYSSDYRFSGVAFRTLFDYVRRTESRLILPRIIREEVVCSFGRRLKKEAKNFSEAHRRYKLLDLDDHASEFRKPDVRRAMTKLRRKLMRPSENVTPIYIPETNDVHVDEVFMRGVHRSRPANDEGEELRDVIIWLWVLRYSASVAENIAFVSQDATFWSGDEPHSHIANDMRVLGGRLAVYRSIDDFVKRNAPTPVEITPEWFSNHFNTAHFERESVETATRELTRALPGTLRDVHLESLVFVRGLLYEVAIGVQFAELQISLSLNLTNIVPKQEPQGFAVTRGLGFLPGGAPGLAEQQLTLSALMSGRPLQTLLANNPFHQRQSELYTRHICAKAEATFSARIKEDRVAEVSLEKLKVDKQQLFSALYKGQTQEAP